MKSLPAAGGEICASHEFGDLGRGLKKHLCRANMTGETAWPFISYNMANLVAASAEAIRRYDGAATNAKLFTEADMLASKARF